LVTVAAEISRNQKHSCQRQEQVHLVLLRPHKAVEALRMLMLASVVAQALLLVVGGHV
jgi:hypothetical protein